MAEFEMSTLLAQAHSLVAEQKPEKWGAGEHMSMLRYLVLACSDKAKDGLEQIKAYKPEQKLAIEWGKLCSEFGQSGKLAECANFYKFLQDQKEMPATPPKKSAKYV